jgi:protein-disulfide isomerase
MHKQAFKAAEAANCAAEQGKYWEMHSWIFANPKGLGSEDLSRHAQALGLDLGRFQQCLDSGKQADEIRTDIADGRQAGVRGTPTFFLGLTNPNDSKVIALITLRGAKPFPSFKEAIESLLSSK